MPMDFYESSIVYDEGQNELGTAFDCAIRKWNEGRFPVAAGIHRDMQVFDVPVVKMDNGHGMITPVDLTVSLQVERRLYFGQLPVHWISGFKDELSGQVITNAFRVGILDCNLVEKEWQLVETEADCPVQPVIALTGLIGWAE